MSTATVQVTRFNQVTELMIKENAIIQRAKKRQKEDKNDVIELAKTMEKRYRLEGNEKKISGICAEIRDIYEYHQIDRYWHVDRDLKDYPQYKRKYTSGSPHDNEMQQLGKKDNEINQDEKITRLSVEDAEEFDNEISEAIELAIEELNKFRIVVRKYPPEQYLREHIKDGFIGLANFWNLLTDKKVSQDTLAAMEVAKRMIVEGVSTGRKEDIIIANICASCSRMVKQNGRFVPMKFHDKFERKDLHNGSVIEVLYNIWQCPECKGFDRMQVPLSREHVANNWHVGITYAEQLMTWIPSLVESITAYRNGLRNKIGVRKLCAVSIFQNA